MKSPLGILLCIGIAALFFVLQLLIIRRTKRTWVRILPLIPILLGLLMCGIFLAELIPLLNAPVPEGGGATLSAGLSKAVLLVLLVAFGVPTGSALVGAAAAWITARALRYL